MTIGEFKKYIADNNLPDDMPIGILDVTTDDTDDSNYPFNEEVLMVDDYYSNDEFEEADYEPKGKMLFITFENKLNENPLPGYQVCYKSNKECKYNCDGLCKESC